MITPFFTINQDDEFIFIDVKISHIRFNSQNIEMIVDNELFIFSLSPYYLRIRLPFACIDDERSHAQFDSKSESVKIKIPKLNKGEFFPDLDLSSKLLARSTNGTHDEALLKEAGEVNYGNSQTPKDTTTKPLIQELDVNNDLSTTSGNLEKDIAEGERFNWEVAQTMPDENDENSHINITKVKYGFNNEYDSIVGVSIANGNDINELGDPEATPASDRIVERLIKENIKFDPEYYAADYIMEKFPSPDDDKLFTDLIEWKSPITRKFMKWYKAQKELPEENKEQIMHVEFSKDEQEKMLNLPRKTYLINDAYKPQLLGLLVSLLFAYHFDLRETIGDHTIESAWTVGKLTPQFACLDSQIAVPGEQNKENFLKSIAITSIRRALSFPLHRNYKLVSRVWDDVYYNLRGGKRLVLKSLLDLKELFRYHDVYYVYDKIWLEDLCSWIISDQVTEGTIRNLAHDLRKEYVALSKTEITFEKLEKQDDNDNDNIGEDNDDEMVALSIQEVEIMAQELFDSYQNQ
ncbi:unnamed protein product [Debaryomyces tyrocola]|nr:unnamed protein product [Debaryomyces tyrocola]